MAGEDKVPLPRHLLRDAILFGLIATIPVGFIAAISATSKDRKMTITVTLKNGTVVTFTACSDYTNDGKVVHIVGTDVDGQVVTMDYNWDSVLSVRVQ